MSDSRKAQTDLFAPADAARDTRPGQTSSSGKAPTLSSAVEPVQFDASMQRLAATLPGNLRLGTSSWAFPGWQSLVYAGEHTTTVLSRKGLRAYAQHPLLRAVGVDRTFYAPISERAFADYAQAVPDDFRFLVKAHAAVTTPRGMRVAGHAPSVDHFLDVGYATTAVIEPATRGLGDRLGVILFQFPPLSLSARRLDALPDALGKFLQALPRDVQYAVEVRNAALLGAPYATALANGGATHCYTVHPTMPGVLEQHAALAKGAARIVPSQPLPALRAPVVIRWMLGHGREYAEARDAYAPFDQLAAPDLTTRADVAALIAQLNAQHGSIIVIANNKAEGSAPRTLTELARLVAGNREY